MKAPVLGPLRALRARCEQREEAATRTLADALRVLDERRAVEAMARARADACATAVTAAREEAASTPGSTVGALTAHAQYIARRRDEHAAARAALDAARSDVAAQRAVVAQAQAALAAARGERDAVDGRIAALVAEAARAAEAEVEEEAGERDAALRTLHRRG